MPKAERASKADQRRLVRQLANAPRYVAVHGIQSTHAKNEARTPCPCCDSVEAMEIERVRIDTLLIDTRDKSRKIRSQIKDKAAFDAVVSKSKQVEMVVRCVKETAALHLDLETPNTLLTGGARSGKTSDNQGKAAWVIFYRGGNRRQLWLGGPTIKKAHIFLKKMISGEGIMSPTLPPELVLSYPSSDKTSDQTAYLIDGTELKFKHCRSVDEWKGEPPIGVHITEAGEIRQKEILAEAQMRVTDHVGQVVFDSTPVMGSHYHELYISALAQEEERKLDPTLRVDTLHVRKDSAKNPWIKAGEMERKRASMALTDPQAARRIVDGEWASDYDTLFGNVWEPGSQVFETFFSDPRQVGKALKEIGIAKVGHPLIDVTRAASRRFFHQPHDWVIGVDVNRNPHTAVICKVVAFGPEADQGKWGLLVWDEVRTWNADTVTAARMLAAHADGAYVGAGVAIDANAAHSKQHPSHSGGRKFTTGVMDYKSVGFNCRPNKSAGQKPFNPGVRDSTNVIKHLMREGQFMVNARCIGVIKALDRQEDAGDGRPKDPKNSGTTTDREIYAFTDALRYEAWPLFNKLIERKLLGVRSGIRIN